MPKYSQIKSNALFAAFEEICQCISCDKNYSNINFYITKASNKLLSLSLVSKIHTKLYLRLNTDLRLTAPLCKLAEPAVIQGLIATTIQSILCYTPIPSTKEIREQYAVCMSRCHLLVVFVNKVIVLVHYNFIHVLLFTMQSPFSMYSAIC